MLFRAYAHALNHGTSLTISISFFLFLFFGGEKEFDFSGGSERIRRKRRV
jgi:hypothetical protein